MVVALSACCPQLPPGPRPFLQRGDLVQQGDHVGVVARVLGEYLQVWPVRHREVEAASDVPVTELTDRIAVRAPGESVVLAGTPLQVLAARQVRIGAVSSELLLRITHAATRAVETERVIRRWKNDRDHRRHQCQPPTGRP